jgi:hypothetical protein
LRVEFCTGGCEGTKKGKKEETLNADYVGKIVRYTGYSFGLSNVF